MAPCPTVWAPGSAAPIASARIYANLWRADATFQVSRASNVTAFLASMRVGAIAGAGRFVYESEGAAIDLGEGLGILPCNAVGKLKECLHVCTGRNITAQPYGQ